MGGWLLLLGLRVRVGERGRLGESRVGFDSLGLLRRSGDEVPGRSAGLGLLVHKILLLLLLLLLLLVHHHHLTRHSR